MFLPVKIEENEGRGLAIIRQSWKKEVFWPAYKQNQLYTKAFN